VPYHTGATVSWLASWLRAGLVVSALVYDPVWYFRDARGAQGLSHRDVDGVELMVAGYLLRQGSTARVLEEYEVADEVEEASFVEDTLEHDL
jgi:hypothetical protein